MKSTISNTPNFDNLRNAISGFAADDRVRAAGDSKRGVTIFNRKGSSSNVLKKGIDDAYNIISGRSALRNKVNRALDELKPIAAKSREVADAISAIHREIRRRGHDARAGVLQAHFETIHRVASNKSTPHDIPKLLRRQKFSEANVELDKIAGLASENSEVAHAINTLRKEVSLRNPNPNAAAVSAHVNTINTVATVMRAPALASIPHFLLDADFKAVKKLIAAAEDNGVQPDIEVIQQHLSGGISKALETASDDVRFSFVVSRGKQFKLELKQALINAGLKAGGDGKIDSMVDAAYSLGVRNGSDSVDEANCEMETVHLHDEVTARRLPGQGRKCVTKVNAFKVDNQLYTWEKQLGKGGNAIAGLYTGANGRKFVLKFLEPIDSAKTEEQAFDELATEAIVHRAACKAAGADIVGLERTLRLPDGRLALVLEFAPHGDVHSLIEKMRQRKDLDPRRAESIRQTLVADCLKSLDGLQGRAGISHLDLKGPNFFISSDGVAKIADLGTARLGNQRYLLKSADNMVWNAAEMDAKYDPIKEKLDKIRNAYKPRLERLVDESNARKKAIRADKSLSEVERKTKLDAEAKAHHAAQAPILATKKAEEAVVDTGFEISGFAADRWSVGTVIFQLYAGDAPFGNGGNMVDTQRLQQKFMAMSLEERRAFLFGRPGMPEIPEVIKDIILSLLDPQPTERMSAKKALKLGESIFMNAGSAQVRSDIKKLVEGASIAATNPKEVPAKA